MPTSNTELLLKPLCEFWILLYNISASFWYQRIGDSFNFSRHRSSSQMSIHIYLIVSSTSLDSRHTCGVTLFLCWLPRNQQKGTEELPLPKPTFLPQWLRLPLGTPGSELRLLDRTKERTEDRHQAFQNVPKPRFPKSEDILNVPENRYLKDRN